MTKESESPRAEEFDLKKEIMGLCNKAEEEHHYRPSEISSELSKASNLYFKRHMGLKKDGKDKGVL